MRVDVLLEEKRIEKLRKKMRERAVNDLGQDETDKNGYLSGDFKDCTVDIDEFDNGIISLIIETPIGTLCVEIGPENYERIAGTIRGFVDNLDETLKGKTNG